MGRHSCLSALLGSSVLNVIQPQCISDQFFHFMMILRCRGSRKSQVLEDEYLSVCVNWHTDFKEKLSTFSIDFSVIPFSSCDPSQNSNAKKNSTVCFVLTFYLIPKALKGAGDMSLLLEAASLLHWVVATQVNETKKFVHVSLGFKNCSAGKAFVSVFVFKGCFFRVNQKATSLMLNTKVQITANKLILSESEKYW